MSKSDVVNMVVKTTELNNTNVKQYNLINTVSSTMCKISRKLDKYDYLFRIDDEEIKQ